MKWVEEQKMVLKIERQKDINKKLKVIEEMIDEEIKNNKGIDQNLLEEKVLYLKNIYEKIKKGE